jgi:hypothetical protein
MYLKAVPSIHKLRMLYAAEKRQPVMGLEKYVYPSCSVISQEPT